MEEFSALANIFGAHRRVYRLVCDRERQLQTGGADAGHFFSLIYFAYPVSAFFVHADWDDGA